MGLMQNLRDPVTVLRASGADEYGNPASSWDAPATQSLLGFLASPEALILGPGADVRDGDRVRVNGTVYAVAGVSFPRSPTQAKATVVRLAGFTEAP